MIRNLLAHGIVAALLTWPATGTAQFTTLFTNGFEETIPPVGNNVEPTIWGTSSGIRYQADPNPFEATNGGFRNGRALNNDTDIAINRLFTPDFIFDLTGQVVSASFDFVEPTDVGQPDNDDGLGFGFGAFDSGSTDLNGSRRRWRAYLGEGTMRPDSAGGDEGVPINYDLDTVHTVYIFANETGAPVNYADQVLDVAESDVWISLDGAAPTFAFSLAQQNSTLMTAAFGFRNFLDAVEEIWLDDIALSIGDTPNFSRDFSFNPLYGDYNDDGVVDVADYTTWRDNVGNPDYNVLNGNGTGFRAPDSGVLTIGDADYDLWVDRFGDETGVAVGTAVPEPTGALLALASLMCVTRLGRRA